MRSVRMRIIVTLIVLAVVGIGGWQLLPSEGGQDKAIAVGTTDAVTALDPAGAYDAVPGPVQQCLPDAADVRAGWRRAGPGRGGELFVPGRRPQDVPVQAARRDHVPERARDDGRRREVLLRPGQEDQLHGRPGVPLRDARLGHRRQRRHRHLPPVVPGRHLPAEAPPRRRIVDRERYPATSLRTGSAVDGTGPYTLTDFVKNRKADLEPNEHYKGYLSGTGRPIELRYYADSKKLDAPGRPAGGRRHPHPAAGHARGAEPERPQAARHRVRQRRDPQPVPQHPRSLTAARRTGAPCAGLAGRPR